MQLAKQIAVFWICSVVWYTFGLVGDEPILQRNPIEVTDSSALHGVLLMGSPYQAAYYWLYVTTMSHLSICCIVAHITRTKFEPWSRITISVVSAIMLTVTIFVI
jgi:hypothetical protein